MNRKGKLTKLPTENAKSNGNTEKIDVPSLARNFPHVLLALLKRIDRTERNQLLEDFKKSLPDEFKQWHNSDVQYFLNQLGDQPLE